MCWGGGGDPVIITAALESEARGGVGGAAGAPRILQQSVQVGWRPSPHCSAEVAPSNAVPRPGETDVGGGVFAPLEKLGCFWAEVEPPSLSDRPSRRLLARLGTSLQRWTRRGESWGGEGLATRLERSPAAGELRGGGGLDRPPARAGRCQAPSLRPWDPPPPTLWSRSASRESACAAPCPAGSVRPWCAPPWTWLAALRASPGPESGGWGWGARGIAPPIRAWFGPAGSEQARLVFFFPARSFDC